MRRDGAAKFLRRVATLAACAYFAALLLLYLFQGQLLFRPKLAYWTTPAAEHVPFEDVSIKTADGVRLHGWWIQSIDVASRGTVLFFHGNGGNISSTLHAQELFRSAGFASLAIDYRGYGESEGSPNELGLYRDADAAWNYVTSVRGIPPARIVIWGYSLGGGVASWLAEKNVPAALVLQSTFTTLPDEGAALYPIFPVRLLSRYRFDTLERLRRIHVPIVVIHGTSDRRISDAQGYANYAAANPPKRFVGFSGGHEVEFAKTPGAWDAIDSFLVSSAGLPARSASR